MSLTREDYRRGGSEIALREAGEGLQRDLARVIQRLAEFQGALAVADRDGVPCSAKSAAEAVASAWREINGLAGVVSESAKAVPRCLACVREARVYQPSAGGWVCDRHETRGA